jgi:hypothetical protein
LPVSVEEAIRVIRGGKRAAKRLYGDFEENFKISAMLIAKNGKELIDPIINTISKNFMNSDILVKVLPKKLIAKKSKDINVKIENIKVRNDNE